MIELVSNRGRSTQQKIDLASVNAWIVPNDSNLMAMSFPMNSSNLSADDLGSLLRHWRKVRGKSQLDLSINSDV
jgi:hypothetical protein